MGSLQPVNLIAHGIAFMICASLKLLTART
jgi:hypothetical protein